MLTPYLPYPLLSGGQIRTYNLLKKLATKHEITLFALIKDYDEQQYIPELEKFCTKVRVFKRSQHPFTFGNILRTFFSTFPFLVIRNYVPETINAIEEELSHEQYDVIHAETFYMMPHLPKTDVPTILVEQTIEYLGYESYAAKVKVPLLRQLLQIDIAKIKRWEKYYWKRCDSLIVMSEYDKELISRYVSASKIEVVANGVDAEWFEQKEVALPKIPTVLSVGTFKWLPNVEAVHFLLQQVWPLVKQKVPNVKLWVVGNAPTKEVLAFEEQDLDVKVTGGIPDIRDAFKGAHVLVAPVFSGKGTRYKILEAMASGTPIVATSIAVEGLGVAHEQEILIANTAQEMADQVARLLADPQLRQRLAAAGKKYVAKNYDWKLISKQLDSVYRQLGKGGYDQT